jgi:hypothetical protein
MKGVTFMSGIKKAVVLATAGCVGVLGFGGTASAVTHSPSHHSVVQKHPKKHKKKHKKGKGMKNGSGGIYTGPSPAPSPAPGAGPGGHDLSPVIWPG